MTSSASILAPSAADVRAVPVASLILRCGAALCFIGHGAFGFITQAAWLPYFAVAGIPESVAWQLMPWIGAVDVLAGMAVLFAPRRSALLYMTIWGAWTAMLRPLAGQSGFEALERAGNYGVPLALLLMFGGLHLSRQSLLTKLGDPIGDARSLGAVRAILRWTTCLLLAGHGALGVLGKEMLNEHYANIGLPATTTALVGGFELALAAAIAVRPAVALLVFVAAWKLTTESLFLLAGDPIWEVVERAGSYAAPLALAVLLRSGAEGERP